MSAKPDIRYYPLHPAGGRVLEFERITTQAEPHPLHDVNKVFFVSEVSWQPVEVLGLFVPGIVKAKYVFTPTFNHIAMVDDLEAKQPAMPQVPTRTPWQRFWDCVAPEVVYDGPRG